MKPFLLLLGVATCLVCSVSLCAVPPEVGSAAGTGETAAMAGTSHLRLFRPFSGSPILVVYYPWRLHANPSIEVQWLPEGEPAPANTRPFGFVDGYLKGEYLVDAERCRAAAEKIATSTSRTKGDFEFEFNAKRNSLGVPAVWVDCQLPKPDHKTETRTVFCLLENWAMDGRTLYLDLPLDRYAKPGKLRLWMLRGKDTVWMETVAWPGLPGGTDDGMAAPAGAGTQKPGDKKAPPSDKDGKAATKPAKPAKPPKKADEDNADDPFAAPAPAKKK